MSSRIEILRKATDEEREAFRESAETFKTGIEHTFGKMLGSNRPSLDVLDGIIDEGWQGELPEQLVDVVASFGCYLGESLIQIRGREWA